MFLYIFYAFVFSYISLFFIKIFHFKKRDVCYVYAILYSERALKKMLQEAMLLPTTEAFSQLTGVVAHCSSIER